MCVCVCDVVSGLLPVLCGRGGGWGTGCGCVGWLLHARGCVLRGVFV